MKQILFERLRIEFGLKEPVKIAEHKFDQEPFNKLIHNFLSNTYNTELTNRYTSSAMLQSEISTYKFDNNLKIKAHIVCIDEINFGFMTINSSAPIMNYQNDDELFYIYQDGSTYDIGDLCESSNYEYLELVSPLIGGEISD